MNLVERAKEILEVDKGPGTLEVRLKDIRKLCQAVVEARDLIDAAAALTNSGYALTRYVQWLSKYSQTEEKVK